MIELSKGSIYAVKIECINKGVVLTQDNGQEIVIHHDDISLLARTLTLLSTFDEIVHD